MQAGSLTFADNPLVNGLWPFHANLKEEWQVADSIGDNKEGKIERTTRTECYLSRAWVIVKGAFGYLALGLAAGVGLVLNKPILYLVGHMRRHERNKAIQGFSAQLLNQLKSNPGMDTKICIHISYGDKHYYLSELLKRNAQPEEAVKTISAAVKEAITKQPLHSKGMIKWENIHREANYRFGFATTDLYRITGGHQSIIKACCHGSGEILAGASIKKTELEDTGVSNFLKMENGLPQSIFSFFGSLSPSFPMQELA